MKWFERADDMYLDFSACRSVLNTPIPFAVRGRAALSNGGGGSGAQMVDECAATHSAPLNMSSLLSLVRPVQQLERGEGGPVRMRPATSAAPLQ